MGEAGTSIDQVGGGCPELRPNKLGGVAVCSAICIQDGGDDSTYQEGVGWIPPQGGPQADRETTLDK